MPISLVKGLPNIVNVLVDVNAMPCTSSSVENIQVDDNIFEADTQIDSIEDHNLDRSPPWFQEVIELSEERRRKRSGKFKSFYLSSVASLHLILGPTVLMSFT